MASNYFGKIFRITTFGESHGVGVGVVIDGCPANIKVCKDELIEEMKLRSGGQLFTTPRKETDRPEILSGVFEGRTTGHPITLLIRNQNADSSAYKDLKGLIRPSHADFTYLKKYGVFDYKGGGRASARETATRVCAGYFAKKIVPDVQIYAYLSRIDDLVCEASNLAIEKKERGLIRCPDGTVEKKMIEKLDKIQKEGDSIGGVVTCIIDGLPAGIGEPIYNKLEACLASAMMSLPASRGVEFGHGFDVARMRGSEHNDEMTQEKGFVTNHAGGILGGISTGERIIFRVAFKPASSIKREQSTIGSDGKSCTFTLTKKARHDPCVCIRAVPIVESVAALVLADLTLQNACR